MDKNRVKVNKKDVIIDVEYTYKEDEELRGLSLMWVVKIEKKDRV